MRSVRFLQSLWARMAAVYAYMCDPIVYMYVCIVYAVCTFNERIREHCVTVDKETRHKAPSRLKQQRFGPVNSSFMSVVWVSNHAEL